MRLKKTVVATSLLLTGAAVLMTGSVRRVKPVEPVPQVKIHGVEENGPENGVRSDARAPLPLPEDRQRSSANVGLDAPSLVSMITRAQSADGLSNLLTELQALNPSKSVELRLNLEALCVMSPDDDPRTADSGAAARIYEALHKFCVGYAATPTSYAYHLSNYDLGFAGNAMRSLLDARSTSGSEQVMRQAEQMALVANDRLELNAAATYLKGGDGRGHWAFGRDDDDVRADPSGTSAIQQLSLELYGCMVFSDCNGRSLRWYLHCTRTLMCSPHESYLDVLRNTHTPRQYAAAERLAAELMRMRMSGSR